MKSVSARSQISLILLAMVVAYILLVFESLGVLGFIYPHIYKLKTPFIRSSSKIIQSSVLPYRMIRNSHKAYRRIQDLERDYSESLAQVSQLEGVAQENEYLRSLLGSSDIKAGNTMVVRSVSAYGQPSIMLPAGADLRIDNPVLISGTVVGRVSQLQYSQAQVSLLSQNNSRSLLLAKTEKGVNGVIRGDGKRVLFTEVLRGDEIQLGDRVVTQGQEGVASNLFIGEIQEIIEDDSSPVQMAVLEQLVSFYETTLVEVRIE